VQTFEARLESDHDSGAWAGIRVPFDAEMVLGSKGRISVTGLINSVPYESSIFPMGDGTHFMHINKTQQKQAGVSVGALMTVSMEAAIANNELDVPSDLLDFLRENPQALAEFEKRTHAFKKEYISWIESAKQPETRLRRIKRAVAKIAAGRRMYD